MKKIIISFLTILATFSTIFSISGCVKTQPILSKQSPHSKPFWINNPLTHPEVKDKIFGLGSAREHAKGVTYQRKLAIARGIDEIASQKGVTVYSELETMRQVSSKGGSTSSQMYSKQTVDGKAVNAKIIEIWKDEIKKELFILMVSE